MNEVLQQSIHPGDAFSTVAIHGHGLRGCERPVNPGEMAKVPARVRQFWGEGIARLQQSMKLVEQVGVAEAHGTRMITGDSEISWR